MDKELLTYIGKIDKFYIKNVKSLVIRKRLVEEKAKDLKIIYTSIHGLGNKPVRRVLHELVFWGDDKEKIIFIYLISKESQ